jgi:riboflavin kinase
MQARDAAPRHELANGRLACDLIVLSTVEGLTVAEASRRLRVTRQGLYKKVKSLREAGYLAQGRTIALTEAGRQVLRAVLEHLLRYFNIVSVRLRGFVTSGLGEGAYYMSLEGYRRSIERLLGFTPYPGTLNVRLDPQSAALRRYLDVLPGVTIPGFSDGARTYGSVKAFSATIENVSCAVILPERTHHPPDIVEVIAPVRLRDALGLRDGDIVEIEVSIA